MRDVMGANSGGHGLQARSQDFSKGGVTWTSDHKYTCARSLGGWGHGPPGNFRKLDALRLLLRPFWDRSRAVVATWLAKFCIKFLAVHVCTC